MVKFNIIKLFCSFPPKLTMAHLSPSVDRDRRPWKMHQMIFKCNISSPDYYLALSTFLSIWTFWYRWVQYLLVTSAVLLVLSICRKTRASSCSISQNCTFRGLPGSYFDLTPLAGELEQNTCNTTSFLCVILLYVAQTYKLLCAIVL